jgi:hypothetical protein
LAGEEEREDGDQDQADDHLEAPFAGREARAS